MSLYAECRDALLDARDRFNTMADYQKQTGEWPRGAEELRVAILRLEELLDTLTEGEQS